MLDAGLVQTTDPVSGLTSMVVTYPDGQQVAFGKAADGSWKPPLGRYATFASGPNGYTLTDKNQTVYTFGLYWASSCVQLRGCGYRLTSITDANGRSITFRYTSSQIDYPPQLTSITSSVSGRALHLTWAASGGHAHVATVSTDPAVPGFSELTACW